MKMAVTYHAHISSRRSVIFEHAFFSARQLQLDLPSHLHKNSPCRAMAEPCPFDLLGIKARGAKAVGEKSRWKSSKNSKLLFSLSWGCSSQDFDAPSSAIESAFRKRSLDCHPDWVAKDALHFVGEEGGPKKRGFYMFLLCGACLEFTLATYNSFSPILW